MRDSSAALEQGREAFNRGHYFLAHELWEEVWRALTDAEQRLDVQGLIQIAAGLHHLQQRRARPGAGLLRKGLGKLSQRRKDAVGPFGDRCLDRLAGELKRLLVELDAPTAEMTDRTAARDFTRFRL